MEERQSRLSSMVWRRLRPYFWSGLYSKFDVFKFCHVLKLIRFNKYLVASSVCCEEQVNPIMNTL